MKKLVLFAILVSIPVYFVSQSQNPTYQRSWDLRNRGTELTGSSQNIGNRNMGAHVFTWSLQQGVMTSCTIAFETSPNNVTWTQQTTGDCTSTGTTNYLVFTSNFIRPRATTWIEQSGTPIVTVTYAGYIIAPTTIATITSAPLNNQNIQNTRFAASFSGATGSIKLTAAATDLPVTGGKVVGNFEGAQTWTTDAFTGVTKDIEFECGATVFTVSATSTIPTSVNVYANQGCIFSVNAGITLTFNGGFEGSLSQHFSGNGIATFSTGARISEVYPEWWGALGDGSTDDITGINRMTTAFTDPVDGTTGIGPGGTPPIFRFSCSNYFVSSTILIPNATVLAGCGQWGTTFTPTAGFTGGEVIQDRGNASKIKISNIKIYNPDAAGFTTGIDLGNTPGGQWGTGGYIENVFVQCGVASTPAGTKGFLISGNVAYVDDIEVWYCATNVREGVGSIAMMYKNVGITDCTEFGMYLQRSSITDIEIESPGATCVGIYVNRTAHISKLTYSQTKVTNTHAIEMDASAEQFNLDLLEGVQVVGAVLTSVCKDNRAAPIRKVDWCDNGSRPPLIVGLHDEVRIAGANLTLNGNNVQNWALRIANNGGVIQHRIGAVGDSASASLYVSSIVGASVTQTTTPTGADASTAFATGGKISSASENTFILNTADQITAAVPVLHGMVVSNNTGTSAIIVQMVVNNRNVNNVTQRRPELTFTVNGTGTVFNLNTSNIPDTKSIEVVFWGFIR